MEKITQTTTLKQYANKYNMLIPKEVCEKIQYTCNKISEVEWSGVLFYTIEGSFVNKDLKIICKDFFVMNVGSAAYTEFDMNPEVIQYMAENPELLDYNMGLIHSHNKMSK